MSTRQVFLAFLAAYCCPVAQTKRSLKVGEIWGTLTNDVTGPAIADG